MRRTTSRIWYPRSKRIRMWCSHSAESSKFHWTGFLPTFPFVPPPIDPKEEWSIATSVRLLTLWQLWIAFRGVVRREVIEASNLYIRQTYGNVRADIYWVFALGLKGRLCYVPSCYCTKRFHRSSGGAGSRMGMRQSLDASRVLRSYLNDFDRRPTSRGRRRWSSGCGVWFKGFCRPVSREILAS